MVAGNSAGEARLGERGAADDSSAHPHPAPGDGSIEAGAHGDAPEGRESPVVHQGAEVQQYSGIHAGSESHESSAVREDADSEHRTQRDPEPEPLERSERRQLDIVRRFGTSGALILGVGAIGAGAAPVNNPLSGVRLIGLPARIPTVAMACSWLGVLMVVVAWLWVGKLCWPGRRRMLSRTQLGRTVLMWALPLAVAPPLFSRDMYCYLAQSEIARRGFDPYLLSPLTALGAHDVLTSNVPNIWRDTAAPYGPLFLFVGRGISTVVGENVVLGVLVWRAVMLVFLAAAIWAIPRLARRCGINPVPAMWLSVANPIVLFHVVSGMHNEALLIGFMLPALELGLRWKKTPGVIIAAVLLVVAGAVKPPAFVALGFLGIYVARRRGGRYKDLFLVAAGLTAVLLVTMTVITVASGWGLGWIGTFDVPDRVKIWLAPMTAFGLTGGGLTTVFGLGNHSDAMLTITKFIGYGLALAVCGRMLWLSFKGRMEPLTALGVTLAALAIFGPVLHPWYLLWAMPLLALSTNANRFRLAATIVTTIVSLVEPPTGADYLFRAYQVPLAVFAALIAFVIVFWLVRNRVPWLGPPPRPRPARQPAALPGTGRS